MISPLDYRSEDNDDVVVDDDDDADVTSHCAFYPTVWFLILNRDKYTTMSLRNNYRSWT